MTQSQGGKKYQCLRMCELLFLDVVAGIYLVELLSNLKYHFIQ